MSARYSAFTTGEGKSLSSDLGFLARTVVVDNLTASWIAVDGAGRYVPPFTYGATFPLGAGVQVAQASWRTPPGIVSPTAGVGQAQLTFTSADLPPSNGQQVVTPSQQVVCTVVSVTDGGAATHTLTGNTVSFQSIGAPGSCTIVVNVPAGTNSLIIDGVFGYAGFPTVPTLSLSVTGGTTGTTYMRTPTAPVPQQPSPPFECVVSPAADGQVSIFINGTNIAGGGSVTGSGIEIIACFGTTTVAVQGSGTGSPVAVNLSTVAGSSVPQVGNQAVVPIATLGYEGVQATQISCTCVAGTAVVLIAGSSGVNIRLVSMTYTLSVTGSQAWAWDNGVSTIVHSARGEQGSPSTVFFGGVPLGVGNGFRIVAEAATAINMRGSVTYFTTST